MTADAPPTYSVRELNTAIGSLLERGFAPRFLVQATASKPQVKKGHLWLTLTDGEASITAVAWASKLKQLDYVPADGEGVTVVGKLNFWAARATLAVQVLDLRPSLNTVLRRFEAVRALLEAEGVIDPLKRRPLPTAPRRVAVLTSVPSSALADMLRTARERWPLSELLVVPIPVQGDVSDRICSVLQQLRDAPEPLQADALVLARGGGSREDLMVFDDEQLCRAIATFPVPVVTGIGHEDDLTVADLVADHRAATPTAAIVSLLPSRETAVCKCKNGNAVSPVNANGGLSGNARCCANAINAGNCCNHRCCCSNGAINCFSDSSCCEHSHPNAGWRAGLQFLNRRRGRCIAAFATSRKEATWWCVSTMEPSPFRLRASDHRAHSNPSPRSVRAAEQN